MSSEAAHLSGKNKKKSSEYVPISDYLLLKEKYENLNTQQDSLIEILEHLEDKVESLKEKRKEEALLSKKEIEKWETKYGELKKEIAKLTKDVRDLLLDETEIQQRSGGVEDMTLSCIVVPNEDVIVISDDDDVGDLLLDETEIQQRSGGVEDMTLSCIVVPNEDVIVIIDDDE